MTLYDLVQYMERIKNTGRPLITTTRPKLTPSDQQAIPIGGTGTANSVALSDLQTMVSTSSLVPGQYYLVSGCQTALYGGTTLLLQAVTDNIVSSVGLGQFYNPKYDTYSVYNTSGTYEIGSVVIYGGTVWLNVSGNVGSVNDNFNLSEDWTLQSAPNATYYYEVWDAIEYDYADDYITSRYDAVNNNLVVTSYNTSYWFWCEALPIQMFRWGHAFTGNSGVQDCRIINSYINNLNFVGGYMMGIEMNNFSYAYDITMENNGYIQGLIMDNSSQFSGIDINNSGLYTIRISNSSEVQDLSLINSSISQVIIDNGSIFYDTTITGSIINTLELTDYSYLGDLTITDDSEIYNVSLGNYSWCETLTLNGTGLYTLILNNSGFGDSTYNVGYISDLSMFDGGFYNVNVTSCNFINIIINGFALDYSSYTIASGMGSLTASEFQFGTITHQFFTSFNGNAGQGLIGVYNLPLIPVPAGFFIEKVIIDGSKGNLSITSGAADACINLGVVGSSNVSGINDTTGLLSAMTVPQVFDLSNSKVTAAAVLTNSFLILTISSTDGLWGSIIGGTMLFEVTLKNVNNNSSNE